MKRFGSQRRSTLKEEGYSLVALVEESAIVRNPCEEEELWTKNDNGAGFILDINGVGYEYVTSSLGMIEMVRDEMG